MNIITYIYEINDIAFMRYLALFIYEINIIVYIWVKWHLTLTALSRRFHCINRVVTARALLVHGAHTALMAFCLHSEVVEITGRVLISQLRHEPMLVTMHQPSAMLEPKGYNASGSSYVFVSEWYPQRLHHPVSAEPAYRPAVAQLDGAYQSWLKECLFAYSVPFILFV